MSERKTIIFKTLSGTQSKVRHHGYYNLLNLSVSTRGVIGQFCGLYFTVRPT